MNLYLKKEDNTSIVKRSPQPEEEETMTYKEHPAVYGNINRDKGIYKGKYSDGINSRESVFDAQAVFRTSEH